MSCTIPTSVFNSSPVLLPWGSSVIAKVVAVNSKGSSIASAEGNGAIILTNPDAPLLLANNPDVTTGQVIGLTWTAGAANGGSPVIDYRISYDQATGTFVTLDSGITALSYTAINLVAGQTYKFKVQARNSFGFSALSSEVSVLAA